MHSIRYATLSALTVVAAACSSAQPVSDAVSGTCTTCHGGYENQTGAPPRGLDGQVTGPAVGAHTFHLGIGVACNSCHVVPAAGAPGHPASRGRATVTFGGFATAGSPADRARVGPPVYDPATYTCSAVYCHGGTLDAGGSATAPSWGEHLANCGTCHSFPPPSHEGFAHRLDCHYCHALSVEADNQTFKAGHLNGQLDFNFN